MSETRIRGPGASDQVETGRGHLVPATGSITSTDESDQVPPALLWVKDAPLFIDDESLARFYDAVVRPSFKEITPIKLRISESAKHDVDAKLGIKGKFGLSSWLSSILGAEVEVSSGTGFLRSRARSADQEVTLEPISSPQRQLDQLLAFYVMNQPSRLLIGDLAAPLDWHKSGASAAVPRALALLDMPKGTKMIPMAAEFDNGKVIKLFNDLRGPSGEIPPAFVHSKKHEYWQWFAKSFGAEQASEVIERASVDNGKIEWIDFRVPLNDHGNTMHLHVETRRRYFTGALAYMAVRRAQGHGLRVVGTLKDGPDINVLALYEK